MSSTAAFKYLLFASIILLFAVKAAGSPVGIGDSLTRIIQSKAPDTVRIKVMTKLARLYLDNSITKALYFAEQANKLSADIHWNKGKVLAELCIGDCYEALRQDVRALEHYHHSAAYARRQPDSACLMKAMYAISEVYAHTHDRDSERYYKLRTLTLSRSVADTLMQVRVLQKMGYYYDYEENYGLAIRYWKECLALLRQSAYSNYAPMLLANLGQEYYKAGRPDSARLSFFAGLKSVQQTNDRNAETFLYLCIAEYYQSLHYPDSGLAAINKALALATEEQRIERLCDAYRIRSELFEAQGKATPALSSYKQYIIFRDSLAHEARNADDARNILRFEYGRQLTAITRQHNALVTTNRQRLYMMAGLGAGLALVALLAGFLYRSLRQNRRKAATITAQAEVLFKQKETIQRALNEKEILMREIHHRVKNNLQVISALQHMQSNHSSDPDVKAALGESQNRVLSIAFIHHNLYQHDDLNAVEMHSFIRELTEHIAAVFALPGREVNMACTIEPLYLDIDTAVPLGLIINELLTNSYKYAFEGRSGGAISISLQPVAGVNGHFRLHYTDDGPGLPPDLDWKRARSLGLRLITQLSRQLDGTLTYQCGEESCFHLLFHNLEIRNRL